MRTNYLLLFFALALYACGPRSSDGKPDARGSVPVTRAVYYWQTTLDMYYHSGEKSPFREMNVQKVYLRLFDLDWDYAYNSPVPRGALQTGYYGSGLDFNKVAFVIFITNNTFKELHADSIPGLCKKVKLKMEVYKAHFANRSRDRYLDRYEWTERNNEISQRKADSCFRQFMDAPVEVQFDCDWTKSTRDKFFMFLTEYKKIDPLNRVTSTVRLDQYKNFHLTGVPPVERVMLMCYNFGRLRDAGEKNSVFTRSTLAQYLNGKPYPLKVDIALPVFNWGVWFKGKAFRDILYAPDMELLQNSRNFKQEGNKYTCLHECDLSGKFIQPGDMVRLETSDVSEILAAVPLIKQQLQDTSSCVALFDFNKQEWNEYGYENIAALYRAFDGR